MKYKRLYQKKDTILLKMSVAYGSSRNNDAMAILRTYRAKPFLPGRTKDDHTGQKEESTKEWAWLDLVVKMIQKHFPDFTIAIHIIDPMASFTSGMDTSIPILYQPNGKGGVIGEFLDILRHGTSSELITLLNKYSGRSSTRTAIQEMDYSAIAADLRRLFAEMMERAAQVASAKEALDLAAAPTVSEKEVQPTSTKDYDDEDDWMAFADEIPDPHLEVEAAREALHVAQKRYVSAEHAFNTSIYDITSGGGTRPREAKKSDVRRISALLSSDVKTYMRSVIHPDYKKYVV